jgi:DNA repair exonuclease SbcCD ATPase subunit
LKWIKKLFGKKDGPSKKIGSKDIDFEDLPSLLDSNNKKMTSNIEKDVSGLLRELEVALSELKESNNQLAEATVEGDFDIRAVKRAKSNRENVTKQVGVFIGKIKVPENKDLKTLTGFYETSMQNLDTCLDNMNRSLRYTKGIFPEESKTLSENLAKLGKGFNNLQEMILEHKREMEAIDSASLNVKEIRELSASIRAEELEFEAKKGKIKASNDELARISQQLEEFRQGDAWKNLKNLQEETNVANERLKKAETNLSSLVLPLSNHLSRIKKLHESGRYTLKPEVKQQLNISLENPSQIDPSFFPELQKIFEDNALDMQTQKKEKALLQVKTAISNFSTRKKEYLDAQKEFEVKKAELAKSETGNLAGLEHKKAELLNKTRLLEEDIENSEKKLAALREDLEGEKENLSASIKLIDSDMKVNF